MANKKMTKRDYFNTLLTIDAVKSNPALVEFVEHELELLAKKNASGSGKMTATQIANEGIKADILECMANEPNRMFTISEIQKSFDCCAEMSNQRVSALVRQLVNDGKIERIEDKRKAYFKIA